jgi:leader peptidase (prepilin peptidase)/N-methyltransferase
MGLALTFVAVFLLGAWAGSFIHLCARRLPYEKSILWPGSRCEACVQPVAWYDTVPILSYAILRGRCRTCGKAIGLRSLLTEVGTGLAFVALLYLEGVRDLLGLRAPPAAGWPVPPGALAVFAHHAVLMCFLITAALTDLEHMEIPLSITVPGTLLGLAGSALLAWPFPTSGKPDPLAGQVIPLPGVTGAYPWPVWYPLPSWLPEGSWQLGLATGLAGALAGLILLRGVRFLFTLGRGVEGLGVGDADLMMMAGAYVGWQAVVLGFFVAVFPALAFALAGLLFRGEQALPFGPSLGIGALLTVLAWPVIGQPFALLFFDASVVGGLAAGGAVLLLAVSFLLRLLRGGVGEKG